MNHLPLLTSQAIKTLAKNMTTFTTEDIEALKTEWFSSEVDPVYEGEYEVLSTAWPWPHRAEWTEKTSWGSAIHVEQWRGLRVQIS